MKNLVVAFLFSTLLLFSGTLAQGTDVFKLENITVKRGQKVSGHLTVPDGVDKGTKLPITIIHGSKEGKTILMTAGIHGSEYSPIIALRRIVSRIDPKKLRGTAVILHISNPPSFFARTIYKGLDGKNLNRVFPGNPKGTVTERIAYTITEKLIRRTDVYVDVHSGDGNESLRPYVAYYENEDMPRDLVETSRKMAYASGFDFIKPIRGRTTVFADAKYTINAGFLLGKPSVNFESGQHGPPQEEDIERNLNGLLNIMRALGILTDKKPMKLKKPTIILSSTSIKSEHTGVFRPVIKRDQTVKKGELLGHVSDVFGKKLQKVEAPFDGVIVYFAATPPITKGETLVNIAEVKK